MKFVFWRSLEAIVALWLVATLTFFALRALPGGPLDTDTALPPSVEQRLAHQFGLEQTLTSQYWQYMRGLCHGDFGQSFQFDGRPVAAILAETIPTSMTLGFLAFILCWLLAIPAGLVAAAQYGRLGDRLLTGMALLIISIPSFVLAPLLIWIFALKWEIFPAALWEGPQYMILPVIALALRPMALIFRVLRTAAVESLQADYIRTARAKGISHRMILLKHVLRNSFLPSLTLSGPILAEFLAGSFIIEMIFAIPGMGSQFVDGIFARDYPLVGAAVLLYSALLIICNWGVDICYRILDPRVKLS